MSLPRLKTYYISIEIKTVWYWWKNRYTNQWNRIDNTEINPHKDTQLLFDKEAKAIQWKTVFSTNGTRTTGYP